MDRERSSPWPPLGGGGVVFLASLAFLLAFPPTLNFADESYILLGAKRMLAGEVIYRDFVEIVGPVSFAFYALAFRLGGVSLMSAKVASAAANALSASLVYTLARSVAGWPESLLAAALFIATCVPVWHMASPHWLSTTLCLLCATTLLSRRLRAHPAPRGLLVGGILALTACNQQQRGLALAVWVVLATILVCWAERREAGVDRADAIPARAPAGSVVTSLCWTATGGLAVTGTVLAALLVRGASLAEIYEATVATVLRAYASTFVNTVPWGGAGPLSARATRHAFQWLPAAVVAALGLELASLVAGRARADPRRFALRASLLLLGVVMVASVLYYPDFIHVAFIAPFSLIVGAGLVARARRALGARDPRLGLAATACVIALLVPVARFGMGRLRLAQDAAPVRAATAFGTVALTPVEREVVVALRGILAMRSDPPPAMFAYNGETGLSLLSGAPNPTPFTFYSPGYHDAAQQHRMRDAMERRPDALILLNLWLPGPGDAVRELIDQRYRRIGAISFVQVLLERLPPHPPGRSRPTSTRSTDRMIRIVSAHGR